MNRSTRTAILLLAVATLVAPAVAWLAVSAEGLLTEVLTVHAARARTRENPDRRERESRALELANHAAVNPAIRSADVPGCPATARAISGPPVPGMDAVAQSGQGNLDGQLAGAGPDPETELVAILAWVAQQSRHADSGTQPCAPPREQSLPRPFPTSQTLVRGPPRATFSA